MSQEEIIDEFEEMTDEVEEGTIDDDEDAIGRSYQSFLEDDEEADEEIAAARKLLSKFNFN